MPRSPPCAIRGKNTRPELRVRSLVHRLGFRFRLHRRDLPGIPDLVLPRHRTVIFVQGCFWHMHGCRFGRVIPKTNMDFWQQKRVGNVQRDKRNQRALRNRGWRVLNIWECWTKSPEGLAERITTFLRSHSRR
ncbi:MAG: very short patch repair endonuclease [Terriglobales bacterium]